MLVVAVVASYILTYIYTQHALTSVPCSIFNRMFRSSNPRWRRAFTVTQCLVRSTSRKGQNTAHYDTLGIWFSKLEVQDASNNR